MIYALTRDPPPSDADGADAALNAAPASKRDMTPSIVRRLTC